MDIEFITTAKDLLRGGVVSVIDRDIPVIESFTNGEVIETLVFMSGLPIPYTLFIYGMAARFSPGSTMHYFNEATSPFQIPKHYENTLPALWKTLMLPADVKELLQSQSTDQILEGLINDLYSNLIREEDCVILFKQLIEKIDDDYSNSLMYPIEV